MHVLNYHQKVVFEDLLEMSSGYVLNFTDRTFTEFFRDFGVNIDESKYKTNGLSKAKRLRCFWETEDRLLIIKVLKELIRLSENYKRPEEKIAKAKEVLIELNANSSEKTIDSTETLTEKFSTFSLEHLQKIDLSHDYQTLLIDRIREFERCMNAKCYLSAMILCGSILEALLLETASKNITIYNKAKSSPKNKDGKPLRIAEWTLNHLIKTAVEVGSLKADVHKFSEHLRDFRNYVHPRAQIAASFNPDQHTCKIAMAVLNASIADLAGERDKC
jgi:hypothetical protein